MKDSITQTIFGEKRHLLFFVHVIVKNNMHYDITIMGLI
jgi:hypothetical protein